MVTSESAVFHPEQFPENFTFEVFWDRWGDKSDYDRETCELLWQISQAHYTDEEPYYYHNKSHPLEILWNAMETSDYAEANGVFVNRKLLIAAVLYHDADYHLPTPKEYDSKEAYSAAIFASDAPNFGLEPDEVLFGQKIIMASKVGVQPDSIEEKIMVRSDIANVGGDYIREFILKNKAYFKECLSLGIVKESLTFAANSFKILSVYLGNDLSLGVFDQQNGRSIFVNNAINNLLSYAVETAEGQGTNSTDLLRSLGSIPVNKLLRRS